MSDRLLSVTPIFVILVTAVSLYARASQTNTGPSAGGGVTKAVSIRMGKIFVTPDTSAATVGEVRPGDDVAVLEHSGPYVRVFVHASGWMLNKGLVYLTDPNGPRVIFGAATDLEQRAETLSGQKETAQDAGRLYYRIFDDFPNSALAGEALYRAADIRWQLEMRDLPTPTDVSLRRFPEDDLLRKVRSKFAGTEWAARADYTLLEEHFTCGDWQEKPKCIDKEIDVYKGYLKQYPNSPLVPQGMYNIVYREGAAWSVYSAEGQHHDDKKAQEHRRDAIQWATDLQNRYPKSDSAARAALVVFKINDGIPVIGKEVP